MSGSEAGTTVGGAEDRARRVAEVNWWHTMDLGGGLVTSGRDQTSRKLATMKIPDRLDGLKVLDIGAWDGFFSFECERRGAERVLAVDPLWRNQDKNGFDQRGFLLARELLASKVEDAVVDLYDLNPQQFGTFDLVLFLGVLYHVKDPLGALERVAALTADRLILETHVDLIGLPRPAAAFYPGAELNSDSSNWWGLNPAAVIAALKSVGFKTVETVYLTSFARRAANAARSLRAEPGDRHRLTAGRLVVHARR